ncbi:hypothetical protein L7F22_018603, partial [Adiantum nelumboides]|nr:hypothetical protein [Adiantum nelumboides]
MYCGAPLLTLTVSCGDASSEPCTGAAADAGTEISVQDWKVTHAGASKNVCS